MRNPLRARVFFYRTLHFYNVLACYYKYGYSKSEKPVRIFVMWIWSILTIF